MKKQTDTFKRLRAVIKDINGDNRQIIKTMQDQIEYLMEFIDIQGEILEEKTGNCQPELTIEQKKRLAHRGKKLNAFLLGQIENTFAPSTVLKWYSELISNKYNSVGANQKKRGRKPVNEEIVAEVLRLAEHNPTWGYERIAGGCVHKRQSVVEYCQQNKEKIDSILLELRQQLRIVMSGRITEK